MYGLPQNTDLGFFHGKTLWQVCVGWSDLVLNFGDQVSMTVTSSIGFISAEGKREKFEEYRSAAPKLFEALNSAVEHADAKPPGTLVLRFANNVSIEFYDDSPQYEAYVIRNGDVTIVV